MGRSKRKIKRLSPKATLRVMQHDAFKLQAVSSHKDAIHFNRASSIVLFAGNLLLKAASVCS